MANLTQTPAAYCARFAYDNEWRRRSHPRRIVVALATEEFLISSKGEQVQAMQDLGYVGRWTQSFIDNVEHEYLAAQRRKRWAATPSSRTCK